MSISEGKSVSVSYTLKYDNVDGEIIEVAPAENPLQFTFKQDPLLPQFEDALAGKSKGDKFQVAITSENAYGPNNPDQIVEVPKSAFIVDGELQKDVLVVGEAVPMSDHEGNQLMGLITELKAESVMIDFNHPLAGEDLYFEGEIIEVA